MNSVMLSLWDTFRHWVSVDWSATTFAIVVSLLGVCALLGLLSFFKGNFDKGKPIKWGKVVLIVLLLGIVTLLAVARFV